MLNHASKPVLKWALQYFISDDNFVQLICKQGSGGLHFLLEHILAALGDTSLYCIGVKGGKPLGYQVFSTLLPKCVLELKDDNAKQLFSNGVSVYVI